MLATFQRAARAGFRIGILLAMLTAAACGDGGSGDGGSGDETGGTGNDTGGMVEDCGTAFPMVPLGYESLSWPTSTPFDADVHSVEGDVANLFSSQTQTFSFRWNEPDLSTFVSEGDTVEVDMDGNSSSFHHWLETENGLMIAARYRLGLGQDFGVDRVPASQLAVDIDDGTKVGACRELLITGEPVYEVFEHSIIFSDGETELTLAAGESGDLDSAQSGRLAQLHVYQALSFQNSTCEGMCGEAPDSQLLIFSQRVDY
jgi:hypothetical protein